MGRQSSSQARGSKEPTRPKRQWLANSDETARKHNIFNPITQAFKGVTWNSFNKKTTPCWNYYYWYDLKLKVPPSTKPDVTLVQVAKTVLQKLQESDSKVAIGAYYSSEEPQYPLLQDPDNTPSKIGGFIKYFTGANRSEKGGDVYMRILMQVIRSAMNCSMISAGGSNNMATDFTNRQFKQSELKW